MSGRFRGTLPERLKGLDINYRFDVIEDGVVSCIPFGKFCHDAADQLTAAQAEIATLKQERDALLETVRWYADRDNYDHVGRGIMEDPQRGTPLIDMGQTARNTLIKLRK